MDTETRVESIEGDAVFLSIDRLHDRLQTALSRAGDVTIDLSGVGTADLSFAQLLVSAALTAERAGRTVTLSKASPALRTAFTRAGIAFDPIAGRIALN